MTVGRLLIFFGSVLLVAILGCVGAGVFWVAPFALLVGLSLGALIRDGAWSE